MNTGNKEKEHGCESEERGKDFERNLAHLEDIVTRLEQGSLSLDESLRLYEDGIKAYKNCRLLLQNAEARVVKLIKTLEGELKEEELDIPENGEKQ